MSSSNQKRGRIQILDLINFKGKTISLLGLYDKFFITEDIFSSTLYGSITITDTMDLKQNFPIIGEERLRIKFKTDDDSFDWVDKEFYVYTVPNTVSSNFASAVTTLAFCSEEMLLNRTMLVSKSFPNKTPSDVVADILKDLPTIKELDAEETFGIQSYIAPNIHPFEVIASMTGRARSKEFPESAGFLFYETLDGYSLKCFDKLISAEPSFEYMFSKSGSFMEDTEDKFFSITQYEIDNQMDILASINSGMFGNTTHSFNIQDRDYNVITYNYFNDEDYKLTKHTAGDDPKLRLQTSVFPFADRVSGSMLKFVPRYSGDQLKDANMAVRYSQMAQIMNGFKMRIEFSGNSKLRAGQMIKVKIPSRIGDDVEVQGFDKFLAGNYLVVSVAHNFEGDQYDGTAEIMKDSYSSDHEEIADELFSRIEVTR